MQKFYALRQIFSYKKMNRILFQDAIERVLKKKTYYSRMIGGKCIDRMKESDIFQYWRRLR